MIGGGDSLPLSARGLIADTASAALVAADGTIDWWCPGRFDAPATFYRLLDGEGGALRVGPAGPARPGEQRYDEGTLVLRTQLPAREGVVEVCDLMPWDGGVSAPDGQRLVRIITAHTDADVEVDVVPGHRFAPVERVERFDGGVAFAGTVVHGESRRMRAGDRMVVTTGEPLSVDAAMDLERRTTDAWRSYLSPLTYDGPYRDAVRRSLLTLKALTYHRTGAVVAAVTTSLPEQLGGERNWDHRYAWLRDASLAVDAAHDAGLREEAETISRWLLGLVGDAELPLAPVFDVEGDTVPEEEELRLPGWRRSQPVRVGNAAAGHVQLDVCADIVSAVHVRHRGPGRAEVEQWDALVAMTDWLSDAWAQPDRGVWGLRGEPRQLVSSKLAAWCALDRMVTLARAQNPLDLSAPGWLLAARQVEAWLEQHGLAIDDGLRQDDTVADAADAALLQVAWRGPWPSDHRVVTKTIDRVLKRLGDGPHIHRYGTDGPGDGLPGREGAFVACSFWAVRALARVGRWEEAHDRMEQLVALSGPLGLLPEEVDPLSGAWLGNLPQALSHLALVQAALELASGPR